MFIHSIPFLGILILVYALLALTIPGGAYPTMTDFLDASVFNITFLPSAKDNPLVVSYGDIFMLVGVVLLAIEIVRATRTDQWSLGNHGLSMLVFVLALVLFLIVGNFATSTFLIITMMTLVDVLVGMTVTIITARRDVDFSGGLGGGR